MSIVSATTVSSSIVDRVREVQAKSLESMSMTELQNFNATSVTEHEQFYALGPPQNDGLPNYVMQVSKKNGGTVEIVNTRTGESLVVWGDPHTNINGKTFSDIYEDKTIILEDGTKVTLDVVPGKDDPSVFYVEGVVVTSADNTSGFCVDNLHSDGDITVSQYSGEEDVIALDKSIADGAWWQVVGEGSILQEKFTATSFIGNFKPMSHKEYLYAITNNPAVLDPNAPDGRLMNIYLEFINKISDQNKIAEGDQIDSNTNI